MSRDVAALTGFTYALAQSLERTVKKEMNLEDAKREIKKLIEQVDDAYAFCYYAARQEKKDAVRATLYRNPDNYFFYDQTKKLLEILEVSVSERENIDNENQQPWLDIRATDLVNAYSYFANHKNENNYAQEKDWKELTYHLKLALYTCFPELVRENNTKGTN